MKTAAIAITLLAPALAVTRAQECQSEPQAKCGDSSQPRAENCCTGGYFCMPWNSDYYQCWSKLNACPNHETDIDYYGNDLETIKGIFPWECCDECQSSTQCAGYTFVNENENGKSACYLKSRMDMSARSEKKGAISAVMDNTLDCVEEEGATCGDSSGHRCCGGDNYCQPWDTGYYQCVSVPDACPNQETDVEYYGNDLEEIKDIFPWECCDKCVENLSCQGYTFVNENTDGQSACYLKTMMHVQTRTEKKGALSAILPPRSFDAEGMSKEAGDDE